MATKRTAAGRTGEPVGQHRLCSREAHSERVERFLPKLEEVLRAEIREPLMPMSTFIHEGNLLVMRAIEELDDLKAAGLPDGFLEELQECLDVLQSAQTVLQAEKITLKKELDAVVQRAREARMEALAAAELAYRNDEVALHRLATARGASDAIEHLVGNLLELSVLLTDCPAPLQKIGIDVDAMALELARSARQLEHALPRFRSTVGSVARDRRDRIYTLAHRQIAELRAFATFAFRRDRSDTRRRSFASEWFRARNRASRRRKAAVGSPEGGREVA